MTKKALVLAALIFPTLSFAGFVESHTNEIFLGETAHPQEKGALQLTAGLEIEEDLISTPLAAEYGFTEKWAAGIELNTQSGDDADPSGINEVELSSTYNFINNTESGFVATAAMGIGYEKEGNDDSVAIAPQLIVYKDLKTFALNAALGLEVPTDSDDDSEITISTAYIRPMKKLFVLVGEIAAEIEDNDSAVSIAQGIMYQKGEMEVGVSIAFGLTDDAPDWKLLSVFSWEIDVD